MSNPTITDKLISVLELLIFECETNYYFGEDEQEERILNEAKEVLDEAIVERNIMTVI